MTSCTSLPGKGSQRRSPGFGLGLRPRHYPDFLARRQAVDWLEVITDNFLVDGGRPLVMLETVRRDYPVALHGVGMSLGSAGGIRPDYVRRVARLAERFDALWVSDHLCWTGPNGQSLHDLYPVPFTELCARRIASHVRQAQDLLRRRLMVENVSSYIHFAGAEMTESEFLAMVAREADCELLVDVNNVFVSSVNHGFDPLAYLRTLPAERVRQIHLAGHSTNDAGLIDTHDHPVCPEVWALYERACALFGPTATMIERDDRIPPLAELLEELRIARQRAAAGESAWRTVTEGANAESRETRSSVGTGASEALASIQSRVGEWILSPELTEPIEALDSIVESVGPMAAARGLQIYHHAYRARLVGVLAEHFPKLLSYVGGDHFESLARAFVEANPPGERPLGRYGEGFTAHLARVHPAHPVLGELAALEWALRTVFDAADDLAWSLEAIQRDGPQACLHQWPVLHPTLRVLRRKTNATAIWRAIDEDRDVPPVEEAGCLPPLAVWRKELQPHFCPLEDAEARFLVALGASGQSIAVVAEQQTAPQDPAVLGRWLQQWWSQQMLLRS